MNAIKIVRRLQRFCWQGVLREMAIGLCLLAGTFTVHAAVTDCQDLETDGQAQCVAPTYAPAQYGVCDIANSSVTRDSAWNACYASLGVTNPILVEGTTLALADCFDKRLVPSTGGVSGSIPWLPTGTPYNDNLCVGNATVRDVDGHHIFGVGNKSGASSTFAFTRSEAPSCPTGFSEVHKTLGAFAELVRCKPNLTCAPDQVLSGGSCLSRVDVNATAKPQTCPKSQSVGDPIYPLNGAMKEFVPTGFSLNGIELTLSYDTTPKLQGKPLRKLASFGALWSSNLHRNLGVGSNAVVVTAYRGDGSAATFALMNGLYVADGDINDRMVAITGGYQYTDAQKRTLETYNSQGQLTRLETSDGASLNFTYSVNATSDAPAAGYLMQVTDNNGRSISLSYVLLPSESPVLAATRGVVSRVTGPDGRSFVALYDANSNLAGLNWADNNTRQYLYEDSVNPWAMTGRLDENGERDTTWTYDSLGRAIATFGPLGTGAYSVSYLTPPQANAVDTDDTANNLRFRRFGAVQPSGTTIVGPRGQSIAWTPSTILGAPTLAGATQPAGSGCSASSNAITYDAARNLISRDDFQGMRTCYAYDSSNRETARVEGLSNTVACTAVLPTGSVLPAGARKIQTTWHLDWRLSTVVLEPLRKTSLTYNGQGATCTSAPAMSSGKPLPLICTRVEQALDTLATSTTQFTYDAAGRVLTTVDPNNHATTYTYYADTAYTGTDPDALGHAAGDLQSVTNPVGHVSSFTQYDKAGRLRQSVDARGVVSDITYTPRGWVASVTTTAPGTAPRALGYSYDNGGQRTHVSMPDGTSLAYGYDLVHRLVAITDARGNAITFTLDSAGNRISEDLRDPTGTLKRTISRSFDALDRVQRVTVGSVNGRVGSSITISVSPTSAAPNVAVSLAAQVTGNNPTGMVTFSDGSAVLGTAPLVSGVASLSYAFPSNGSKSLSAVYGGDGLNTESVSSTVILPVVATTSVSLSASPNPVIAATPVSLSARVAGGSPAGTVTFKSDSTVIGTAAVANGVASLSYTFSTSGSRSLSAIYGGDAVNTSATSPVITLTVSKVVTTTTLTLSTTSVQVNTPVTMTAQISGTSPAGNITFSDGNTVLGSVALINSTATFTYTFTSGGSKVLTASYSGDGTNSASTSTAWALTVVDSRVTTATAFICDDMPNFQTVVNMYVRCVVQVSPAPGAGTVQIFEGTKLLGSASIYVSVTSYSIASVGFFNLSVGSHPFKANYIGDSTYKPSQSAPLSFTVLDKVLPSVALTCPTASPWNCQVTMTTTYPGIFTGGPNTTSSSSELSINYSGAVGGSKQGSNVFLWDSGTQLYQSYSALTESADRKSAVINATYPGLSLGTHNLKATYSGNDSLLPATSPDIVRTVQ